MRFMVLILHLIFFWLQTAYVEATDNPLRRHLITSLYSLAFCSCVLTLPCLRPIFTPRSMARRRPLLRRYAMFSLSRSAQKPKQDTYMAIMPSTLPSLSNMRRFSFWKNMFIWRSIQYLTVSKTSHIALPRRLNSGQCIMSLCFVSAYSRHAISTARSSLRFAPLIFSLNVFITSMLLASAYLVRSAICLSFV